MHRNIVTERYAYSQTAVIDNLRYSLTKVYTGQLATLYHYTL